jgi:colanic acid/amylovoran biosynthesis glycosyltransferase
VRPTILHGKFSSYLPWSQPFLHALLEGLASEVRNVVLCHRIQNLDRFPVEALQRIRPRTVREPLNALLAAALLRERHRPDCLHAHFGWSGLRMLYLKHFLQLPMVTTFGGRDVYSQLRDPVLQPAYRMLLEVSDRIVCVSSELRERVVSEGASAERTLVIRRGTDLRRFRPVERAPAAAGAPLRVLMVGRLVEKKGHADGLRAVRRLLDQGLAVVLTIVGEGEEFHPLRRLRGELGLGDRCVILPPMDQSELRDELARADVFLHCSRVGFDGDAEGLPNAVVEAAATGLPVVATRHGGLLEAVRDGETGFLVDEGDADAIAVALRRLAEDAGMRRAMGEAAAAFARAEFDLEYQVKIHLSLYRELTEEYGRDWAASRRAALPPGCAEPLRRALHSTGEPAAGFSLSEMFEELLPGRGVEALVAPGEPGPVSRIYESRLYLPGRLKLPLKRLARAALVPLVWIRHRADDIGARQMRELEEALLAFSHRGGRLEDLLATSDVRSLASARALLQDRVRLQPALEDDEPYQSGPLS